MRPRIGLVLAVAGVLAAGAPTAVAGSGNGSTSLTSGPEIGPLISGTHAYVQGAFVWTGYAYNDFGAATQGSSSPTAVGGAVVGGSHAGTATYPASSPNAANLIQLQLARTTGGTKVTALLETLKDRRLPLLGLGFDTDSNGATGSPCVPGGYWRCKGSLGLEHLLIADSAGGRLLTWTGGAWKPTAEFTARVDPARNTITTTIPDSAMPKLGTADWRAVGVLGLTTASWVKGGPIYNLAFDHDEPFTGWQDSRQAAILAGQEAATDAMAVINAALVRGRAGRYPDLRPGYHTFLFHSRLTMPEGLETDTSSATGNSIAVVAGVTGHAGDAQGNWYVGPYQPYMVWLPKQLPHPAPLLVWLNHGNHIIPLFGDATSPFGGAPAPVLGSAGTFDVPAVVIAPLGGTTDGYFNWIGEQDVLDAIADVQRRLGTDTHRVVLSGNSAGGYGTWRLGQLHPDVFSALVPIMQSTESLPPPVETPNGSTGPGQLPPDFLNNVRNLRLLVVSGGLGEFTYAGGTQDVDFARLTQMQYGVKMWTLTTETDSLSPPLENCLLLDALSRPASPNPPRASFTTEPAAETSDRAIGLELRYRSAYWVSDLTSRTQDTDPRASATIDVTSLGRADRATTTAVEPPALGQNVTAPADLCGSAHATAHTNDSWWTLENRLTRGPAQPVLNGLQMTLTNLSSASFDLPRASVSTSRPIRLDVSGDGPAALTLLGPWRGAVTLSRDGAPAGTLSPDGRRLSISADFAGSHTFLLTP